MTTAKQPHIERAEHIVRDELRMITDERDAWDRFLHRVHDLQVDAFDPNESASPTAGTTATLAAPSRSPSPAARRIRTAYRETVMAVPHYDAEYGDSLAASIAVEFDPALAETVANATSVSAAVHRTLVEGAVQARRDRAQFRKFLDHELTSIEDAASELDEVETGVRDLESRVERASARDERERLVRRLDRLERRCEAVAGRRQELIHNRSTSSLSGIDGESLTGYLYAETGSTCPVLADVAACADTVSSFREACRR